MRASAARPACQLVTASATPTVAASSVVAPRKMRPLRPRPRFSTGSAPIKRDSGSVVAPIVVPPVAPGVPIVALVAAPTVRVPGCVRAPPAVALIGGGVSPAIAGVNQGDAGVLP